MNAFEKNLLFFFHLARMRLFRKWTPLTVILNVTDRCNCNCRHCYADYASRHGRELTTRDWLGILRDLRRNGCHRVSFSGGEPLLRRDLGVLLDAAQGLGMGVTINTNGMLIPEHLDVCRKADVLAISVEGREGHHDQIRGSGTFAKMMSGLKAARRAGIKVHTNTVLNRLNAEDIDFVLDLAVEFGLKAEFALMIEKLTGRESPEERLKLPDGQTREVLRDIIRKKRGGKPILFSEQSYQSVLASWHDFAVDEVWTGSELPLMPTCPAGKIFGLIDADGTFWACPHLIGKIPAGNVLTSGVKEAWRQCGNHPCRGCFQVYHHEFSFLMDMKPLVLWNYIRDFLSRG
jgi:MoaA/NifB/PqqE/SkfB family radical SAM enzyme